MNGNSSKEDSEAFRHELKRKQWGSNQISRDREVWLKLCAAPSGRNIYTIHLKKWTDDPDQLESNHISMDIPRTLPQLRNDDEMSEEEVVKHHSQLARVLGALMSTKVSFTAGDSSQGLVRYRGGSSFIASFLLMVGNHDEEFAYALMVHAVSRFPAMMPGTVDYSTMIQQHMSQIDEMIRTEFPRIHYAFDEMGVQCSQLYFGTYACLMFCHRSIPFDFTLWCWDQFMGTNSALTAAVILVSLLGTCEKLVINTKNYGGISIATLLSVVDKSKFHTKYSNLVRKYITGVVTAVV